MVFQFSAYLMKLPRWPAWQAVTAKPFDPSNRFETSWIMPPFWLSIARASISIYTFLSIFVILGYESTHGSDVAARRFFSYFSSLNLIGLAFYFAVSAVHTWTYASSGRALLDHWWRWAQELHSLLYTTVVVFPWLVTSKFVHKSGET